MSNSVTYIDYSAATPIKAAWLNDVNQLTYVVCGDGSLNPPTTAAQLIANLGVAPASTAATLAGGQTLTNKTLLAATNTVEATSGPNGSAFSFRNHIINGDMRIDQRNSGAAQTLVAASGPYTVDRFFAVASGANATGQQVAGTLSQYCYQITGAAGVTGVSFSHRVEAKNSYDLAGNMATLSLDLANSLLTTVSWQAIYANTADNFGGQTVIASGTFPVSSTMARYSAQINMPSGAQNGVQIVLSVGAQVSGTWKIGRVQLEAGSVATPFESRPIGVELALCQRYYLYEPFIQFPPVTSGISTQIFFKAPMRIAPSTGTFTTNNSTPAFAIASTGVAIVTVSGGTPTIASNGSAAFSAEL